MTGRGRLLSVALTEQQVLTCTKFETRRLGWWLDKNGRRLVVEGDPLQLVRKSMGRRPGEPVVVLARVEVVSVSREPLNWIIQQDVDDEGFPTWTPERFVEFFTSNMKCEPSVMTTVIRWKYLQRQCQGCAGIGWVCEDLCADCYKSRCTPNSAADCDCRLDRCRACDGSGLVEVSDA